MSLQPNQGLAVEIGPGNAELSAWLEHVGTLNAIEAILEAERHRQRALAASSAPSVLAGAVHGLDGFGWLADAGRSRTAATPSEGGANRHQSGDHPA